MMVKFFFPNRHIMQATHMCIVQYNGPGFIPIDAGIQQQYTSIQSIEFCHTSKRENLMRFRFRCRLKISSIINLLDKIFLANPHYKLVIATHEKSPIITGTNDNNLRIHPFYRAFETAKLQQTNYKAMYFFDDVELNYINMETNARMDRIKEETEAKITDLQAKIKVLQDKLNKKEFEAEYAKSNFILNIFKNDPQICSKAISQFNLLLTAYEDPCLCGTFDLIKYILHEPLFFKTKNGIPMPEIEEESPETAQIAFKKLLEYYDPNKQETVTSEQWQVFCHQIFPRLQKASHLPFQASNGHDIFPL